MKVSGYQLREAIRRWTVRRDLAYRQFKDSLFTFGEDGKSAKATSQNYLEADSNVAMLEDAQQRYNQLVTIAGSVYQPYEGCEAVPLTLSLAVKQIGGVGRFEKMWRDAVTDTGGDRYSRTSRSERSKDTEYAKKTVSDEEALKLADDAARRASFLRAGIAKANATEIEITGLDPDCLV